MRGITTDPNDSELNVPGKDGMNKKYLVLSEEERAKGFIRPLRTVYVHRTCEAQTKMGLELCETYARNPSFYGATFCVECKNHFPVSEFYWLEDGLTVGS